MIVLRPDSDWKTKSGSMVHIVRLIKNCPREGDDRIYWSLAGSWYRIDGAYMACDINSAKMYALRDRFEDQHKGELSYYDIVEEVIETP